MVQHDLDAVIGGAGAAGLRAALALREQTDRFLVVEREGRVGGRIRTIERDGFLLDRGFQIFLTASALDRAWRLPRENDSGKHMSYCTQVWGEDGSARGFGLINS